MKKTALLFFTILALTKLSKAQQWGDYTLIAQSNLTSVSLIDTNSQVFHQWTNLTGTNGYSAYLMPGGILVRSVKVTNSTFNGGGMTGKVQKIAWDGTLLWDFTYSTSTYNIHHDICPLPNGNVLMISYELKSATDVANAGCSTFSGAMWPDKIIEVQPTGLTTGNIVWEWHVWDHVVQNTNAAAANYQTSISAHPELLNINYNAAKDWLHMNGLDYNAARDEIAVSSHFMNELYVIDHSTTTAQAASHSGGAKGKGGDFLYRWGIPAAYGVAVTANFSTIHDAHWIPSNCPKAGWLVGYNNQGSMTAPNSFVDEFNPPYGGPSGYTFTAGVMIPPSTYGYRHICNGHNTNEGNSEQLPNGNILVCIAMSSKVYEADSNENVLWTYNGTGTIGQAHRYVACDISTHGPPSAPTITQNGSALNSTTGMYYQWYMNGGAIPGATTANYTATIDGNYQVVVKDTFGCASALSNTITIGTPSSSEVLTSNPIKIYPNPSTGWVEIKTVDGYNRLEVEIVNPLGKTVFSAVNQTLINLSSLDNGIYFIRVKLNDSYGLNEKLVLQKK